MPLVPGDIKINPPIQSTLAGNGNRTWQVYRIHFSIRGTGNYSVDVPVLDYTPQKAQAAIEAKAKAICETLDLF